MPLSNPWPSWRPCVISRFTASLMPSLPLCSPPVTTAIKTIALLNSPRKPPSRCCCPSAPQQSNDPPHQSIRCPSASHAVTRAASTQHPCHIHIPTSRISCTMSRPSPLTCPLLTKSIVFRRLNRPRLAHTSVMPSSSSCSSEGREAHVASVDDKCATPHTASVFNTQCNVPLRS